MRIANRERRWKPKAEGRKLDGGFSMTRKRAIGLLTCLVLTGGSLVLAQKPSETMPVGKNPHLGNKASIQSGLALYRVRCGDCHGLDAKGYRGPDLTVALGGMPDQRLFQTIRKGVPGTEMPLSNIPDDDVLMIMAYLRNLGGKAAPEKPLGNVDNGAQLFASQCASCHRVGDRGGRLGPDLSRVGVSRSQVALIREIRTPSEWMPPGFEPVTLVMKDGQKIRGVMKGEDVFSIQVMDTRERIQGYLKSSLQEVIYEKTSLMPEYGPDRLTDAQLNDLVGYLSTLRTPSPSTR
jgi:putative heme-binding domain-containing protein